MFVCLGIFLSLSLSRFIPHPPNFTSLLALSFYVPAILGLRYLPILLISFAITDFIIGYHSGTFFTWGSVFMIGIMANYLSRNLVTRLSGALLGAFIFYLVTNFGVWLSGMGKGRIDRLGAMFKLICQLAQSETNIISSARDFHNCLGQTDFCEIF